MAGTKERPIATFLDDLASDAELQARYDADPRAVMTEYGLSKGQQDKILGSPEELRKALREEIGTAAGAYILRMAPSR